MWIVKSLVSRVSYIRKTFTTELTYRDSRPIDTKQRTPSIKLSL